MNLTRRDEITQSRPVQELQRRQQVSSASTLQQHRHWYRFTMIRTPCRGYSPTHPLTAVKPPNKLIRRDFSEHQEDGRQDMRKRGNTRDSVLVRMRPRIVTMLSCSFVGRSSSSPLMAALATSPSRELR